MFSGMRKYPQSREIRLVRSVSGRTLVIRRPNATTVRIVSNLLVQALNVIPEAFPLRLVAASLQLGIGNVRVQQTKVGY